MAQSTLTHPSIFGEKIDIWWASSNGGMVRRQFYSDGWTNAVGDAFALATEPGSLQVYQDDRGDWYIVYPSSSGTPVRYRSSDRVNWVLV
ncbi:MAG: hypothetical protein ACYDCO_28070 [Armatimonadota bacterium]